MQLNKKATNLIPFYHGKYSFGLDTFAAHHEFKEN